MVASAPSATAGSHRAWSHLCRPILADLEIVEHILQRELDSKVPFIRELVAHLSHYRGKRLRPALLLMTAQACGGVKPEHHTLSAVVEMVHTATLVHDDVLDEADLRRHVPTIHAKWGNAASVLLGDMLFTHAFYLASTTGSAFACQVIGEATNRVCEGELRQVGERGNLALTVEAYYAIIQGKTAELTACCCRLGAFFANAPKTIVEALTCYGRELGIAFQIADDLLDLVGQEESTGKSLGTDIEQRKLTLPLIRLLQTVPHEQSRQIRHILNSGENHKREKLSSYFRESDALAYATRQAEEHAVRAREQLACLPATEARGLLDELTQLVVHRTT